MLGLTIRSTKTDGKTTLYTRIKVEGKSTWVDLQLLVDIDKWYKVADSERKISNYLYTLGYSEKLNEIEVGIKDLRSRHRLTKASLENLIQNVVLSEVKEQLKKDEELEKVVLERRRKDVKNFIKNYVDGIVNGEILNTKGKRYSKNSINSWKQFRRIFLDCFKNQSFTWDDLSQQHVHAFLNYLDRQGYMRETKNRHIGIFSTIITIAEKQRLHTNGIVRKWLTAPIAIDEEKRALIYLTKDELKSIYDLPLTGMKEKARDLFLIACYTALRYSDFSKIKKGCIGITLKGTKVIRLTQQKTSGQVVIPIINEELEVLLKKYDYNVPSLSEQKINDCIKLVCEHVSKTVPSLCKRERTRLTKTERELLEKGKREFEFDAEGYPVKPRWELVCCHTARRTAITNMYLSGKFSTRQIMSVSGHKKEDTFLKYIRLSLDERADDVASAASDGLF